MESDSVEQRHFKLEHFYRFSILLLLVIVMIRHVSIVARDAMNVCNRDLHIDYEGNAEDDVVAVAQGLLPL